MTDLIAKLATVLQPVGLATILVYLYGYFSRSSTDIKITQIIMGVVFGLAAIVAMASPIQMSSGVMVDLRNLFVGISAAFFGWRGGSITLALTVLTRLGIGGDGVLVGIVAASISGTTGLIWHHFISPRIRNIFVSLPILASLISLHIAAAFLLPAPLTALIMQDLAPVALIFNFAGTGIFALLIYREIALADEENRLRTEATTDPLTRVLNRRYTIEIYGDRVQGKPGAKGVAMSCIDIDNFKKINDVYGHLAGDHVLVSAARRIASCLRDHDLFCRMSGDEFLIIMTDVHAQEASAISERCRAAVAEAAIDFDNQSIGASISIGTVWASQAPAFNQFRNAADEALYRAKSMGRDCSSFAVHRNSLLSAIPASALA
tara:strand:- start:50820 stop:51950 length:1131 start_codon:yes stop_codon:yes gene_type:complete